MPPLSLSGLKKERGLPQVSLGRGQAREFNSAKFFMELEQWMPLTLVSQAAV